MRKDVPQALIAAGLGGKQFASVLVRDPLEAKTAFSKERTEAGLRSLNIDTRFIFLPVTEQPQRLFASLLTEGA